VYLLYHSKIFFRFSDNEIDNTKNIHDFLNIVSEKPKNFKGFFVSNVKLGEDSKDVFNDSINKSGVCVCLYQDIVNKIKEYAKIF
jgi:hypothetical protein